MLHIHNGESSAGTARNSTVPGEHFAFADALIAGPTPTDLSESEWRRLRAAHLASSYGSDYEKCEQALLCQDETLSASTNHDEVVLWFEHDLFCQVNLVYLLNWFRNHDLGKTRLSLICIDRFPGMVDFRGLGQLNAEQLAGLLESRHEVTPAELELGAAAWSAYCAPEPTAIQSLLNDDTTTLPYLQAAFGCHLTRFPSVRNGLGRIEDRALALIEDGHTSFMKLFPQFMDAEPIFGLGDFQLFLGLKQLHEAQTPLLDLKNGTGTHGIFESEKIRDAAFQITAAGQSVLRGATDSVQLNGIDLWLGGVHLSKENLWRWDEEAKKIVRAALTDA
jgi:hypothetical protein